MIIHKPDEFTREETARQDHVDYGISLLIARLLPDDVLFSWDIELIGIVRDALQEVIVDRLGVMSEMEFYPYREISND